MKPFSMIAIPHRDIIEGRLTMEVFAADLWEVFKGRAPEEYQNPEEFFRKTHLTSGLKNLLDIAEKRLQGKGGDPIIQIQTPFGGGKTHSLIALYHKAKDWNAKVVVFSGDKFSVGEEEPSLWQEIERQLEGRIEKLKGFVTPGGEKIRELLSKHQPLIILLDEIHEYVSKALGIKVGDSNLASQTITFIQELTGAVRTLDKTILFVSLPSSDPYRDEKSEEILWSLQNILGRVEKIYTPVQDDEISEVIRKRLFNSINEKEAKKIIEEFLDYAEKEKLLPEGVEKAHYREKFLKSFPFQPEVIDVLYKRWGSFPNFQRTRGVLRILALLVYSLKDSKIPFIRLGDFSLENDEIRRELVNYIGQEYDSIISQDITSMGSGAKKVDRNLGDAYTSFSFGTKCATAIFMYSFSGGPERGATPNEIKLSCADPSAPSSIVVEAITQLKENLFYLSDTGLFFANQPNLNRILLDKMENISENELEYEEKTLLESLSKSQYFKTYIWPNNSRDVADTKDLKLIILKDREKIREIFENCGDKPRVYRNTLIFLCPLESAKVPFSNFLKKKIAWRYIESDKNLHLTEEQKKEVEDNVKRTEKEAKRQVRELYRTVLVPSKDGFKEIDLGIPTYGDNIIIDGEIYEKLKSDGEILEKLSPLIIKEKYLGDNNYVITRNIIESFYKTPGEIRIISEKVLTDAIKEGTKQGLFRAGYLENDNPKPQYFQEEFQPSLEETEIIIKAELCQKEDRETEIKERSDTYVVTQPIELKEEIREEEKPKGRFKSHNKIYLELSTKPGKLSDIVRIINLIKDKFEDVNITVTISAQNGEITIEDYENKIKEAIYQAGITIKKECV